MNKCIIVLIFIFGLLASLAFGQDSKQKLIQEYKDYCLEPPSIDVVGPAVSTKNFGANEFTKSSDYAPIVVNGGMDKVAQSIRDIYDAPLLINSAYRNPKHNASANGVKDSVHMSGGAVDLAPKDSNLAKKVSLYNAALQAVPGMVLLEQGPQQLLPGNAKLPVSNTPYAILQGTVVFQDTDDDGLVDSVKSVLGSFKTNVSLVVGLLTIVFQDSNSNGSLDKNDFVLIRYKDQSRSLADIFKTASHVHADNRKLIKIVEDCKVKTAQVQAQRIAARKTLLISDISYQIATTPTLYFALNAAINAPQKVSEQLNSKSSNDESWEVVASLMRQETTQQLGLAQRLIDSSYDESTPMSELWTTLSQASGQLGKASIEELDNSVGALLNKNWSNDGVCTDRQQSVCGLANSVVYVLTNNTDKITVNALNSVFQKLNADGLIPSINNISQSYFDQLKQVLPGGIGKLSLEEINAQPEKVVANLIDHIAGNSAVGIAKSAINKFNNIGSMIDAGNVSEAAIQTTTVVSELLINTGILKGHAADNAKQAVIAIQNGVAIYQTLAALASGAALGPVGFLTLFNAGGGLMSTFGGGSAVSPDPAEIAFRQQVLAKLDQLIGLAQENLQISREIKDSLTAFRADFAEFKITLIKKLDRMEKSLDRIESNITGLRKQLDEKVNEQVVREIRDAYTGFIGNWKTPTYRKAIVSREPNTFAGFGNAITKIRNYGLIDSRLILLPSIAYLSSSAQGLSLKETIDEPVDSLVGTIESVAGEIASKNPNGSANELLKLLKDERSKQIQGGSGTLKSAIVNPGFWFDSVVKLTDMLTRIPKSNGSDVTTGFLTSLCETGCTALKASKYARALLPQIQASYQKSIKEILNYANSRVNSYITSTDYLKNSATAPTRNLDLRALFDEEFTKVPTRFKDNKLKNFIELLETNYLSISSFQAVLNSFRYSDGKAWVVGNLYLKIYVQPTKKLSDVDKKPFLLAVFGKDYNDTLNTENNRETIEQFEARYTSILAENYVSDPNSWIKNGEFELGSTNEPIVRSDRVQSIYASLKQQLLKLQDSIKSQVMTWFLESKKWSEINRLGFGNTLFAQFGYGNCILSGSPFQDFLTNLQFEWNLDSNMDYPSIGKFVKRLSEIASIKFVNPIQNGVKQCEVGNSSLIQGVRLLQAVKENYPDLLPQIDQSCINDLYIRPPNQKLLLIDNQVNEDIFVQISVSSSDPRIAAEKRRYVVRKNESTTLSIPPDWKPDGFDIRSNESSSAVELDFKSSNKDNLKIYTIIQK